MTAGGINFVEKQKAIHNWVVACTGIAADHIIWGHQQAPRPAQPGIVLRLMTENDEDIPWVDTETQPLVIPSMVITSVDDVANTLTKTAHGLLTGDGPVRFSGLDLPDGVLDTVNYWIVKVDADSFKLANSFVNAINGVTIDLLDAGSGVITLDDTDDTLRAGQEIKFIQRSLVKALLTLECYTDVGVGMDMASAILWRVAAKRLLPTPIQILQDANIGISEVTRVRSYGGTQGQYLFEPRASLDVALYLVSEDSEDGTIVERTEITNEDTGVVWTVDAEP